MANEIKQYKIQQLLNSNGDTLELHPETDASVVNVSEQTYSMGDNVQTALETIYAMASGGGVTGVKGNAESTYRQGNVNLTPANIGAQPSFTDGSADIASVASDIVTIKGGVSQSGGAIGNAPTTSKPDVVLAKVAKTGSYNDLSNKPTIPTVNNATLTIQKNGTSKGTFTANASTNATINIDDVASLTSQTTYNGKVDAIEGKIPSEASSTNKLADKDFVNNAINSVTAYYITKNAVGDPFATKAELNNATTFYSGGEVRTPTRNDYCIVLKDESKRDATTGEDPTTRYIYNSGWEYQYTVNTTGFTQAQWDAVNSGITTTLVGNIQTNNAKVSNVQADWNATTGLAVVLNKPSIPTKTSDLTNDRFVRYDTNSQGLSSTQQSNARANIGAGTSNFSGSYNDLTNKPTIDNNNQTVKAGSVTFGANDVVEIVAGTNVSSVVGNATNKTITINTTDTTYESKSASSGGTAVSLVTTGEKYTWNNKGSYSKPSGGIPSTDLANSGVTAGTYSCVAVNAKGLVTSGQQIIEVGTSGQTTPSSSLAIGGLFFKQI